jgi:hypothetical protein
LPDLRIMMPNSGKPEFGRAARGGEGEGVGGAKKTEQA